MLAEVQGAVLDFLQRSGLRDSDGFARRAAVIYVRSRAGEQDAYRLVRRVRTSVFSQVPRERSDLTAALIKHLDKRFAKKIQRISTEFESAPAPPAKTPVKVSVPPAARFSAELKRFKTAVEARNVADFWVKRTKRQLKKGPERIGQSLLVAFLSGVLRTRKRGTVLQEVQSGVGFIDVMVFLKTSEPLIAELKVLPNGKARGKNQLRAYLKTEGVTEGWLVIFDARKGGAAIPEGPETIDGITVTTVVVRIDPPVPSSLG